MDSKNSKQEYELEKLPKDPGSKLDEETLEKSDRGKWDNKAEFLLSILGYAVGFGNVWRFPYLCFKNGGAAFLIPYAIMLLCAGFPLFFMELVLGQYASLGPNILFVKMAPIFTGVGYSMLVITLLITVYYNLIFAWVLFYTFASFTSVLPWSSCDHSYNSPYCYTQLADENCNNSGLVYYNNSCLTPLDFCDTAAKLTLYNETHCASDNNGTNSISFESSIDRKSSSEDYYRNRMLQVEGTSWDNMGSIQWELVGCLALAWIIICVCMIKGVKSSGKVVYFTATFPYVVLVILFIRGITLPGSYLGIEFYIMKPNITKLMDVQVWNDAATQIFYSLGTGTGVLVTLSSYNGFKNNCYRDALFITVANSCTSVFAGFVIFSILGFMATELGVEVKDVVESGSGLAFIAYPEAVSRMPVSPLWSCLFFFMLITLGIDSQFSYMETVVTSFFDRFEEWRPWKPLFTCLITFVLFLCGITMCLQGGVYMFELFVWYSSGISLIAIGLIEIIVVTYFFGFKKIMGMTKEMGLHIPSFMIAYLAVMWYAITPLALFLILVLSIYFYVPAYYGDYVFPASIQTVGWLMCTVSILCIPVGAIYVACTSGKSMKALFDSSELVPFHVRQKKEQELNKKESFIYTTAYDNQAFNKN